MKSISLVLLVSLGTILANAQDATPLRWYVDTDRPATHSIEIRRGESVVLEPVYRSQQSVMDLSAISSVTLRYATSDMTNAYYAVTGSVYMATSGVCRIRWTPEHEITNRSASYQIVLSSSTSSIIRAYGQLTLLSSLADNGATNVMPVQTGFLRSSTGRSCTLTNVIDGVTNLFTFVSGQLQ
jgi:hypothetical protein